jgi:hypothetical protein
MKEKKIAILQSNYIPWKGYFDIINMVDEFILYDDVQYTKSDWRNRNKIKTPSGFQWITIPVDIKGKFLQKINETKITNKLWNRKHWKSILQNYSKAKYFKDYREIFEELYMNIKEDYLSRVNYKFISLINEILCIKTVISSSYDYNYDKNKEKTEKLISLCKCAGATSYFSGPAAKNYITEELFHKENIKLIWVDYTGYREYNQLYPPFEHMVSIIDLIFNEGPDAKKYMKSFRG